MPANIKVAYRRLAEARGLWAAGGSVATNQDLSDLFVVRAIEQYLRPGGRFAFVMPYGVLSRRQYAGFRTGDWTSAGSGTLAASFDAPESYVEIKPSLFPVPSCVVTGRKSTPPVALPTSGRRLSGKVANHHQTWEQVAAGLVESDEVVEVALDNLAASPYKSRFTQGATIVPRVLINVQKEPAGPLGVPAGQVKVRSSRSSQEKKPWKYLPDLTGVLEEQFVRPLHLGSTILPYRTLLAEHAVVPVLGTELLDSSSEKLEEHPGLAAWWHRAERLWEANKNAGSTLALRDRLDYQSGLRKQFPLPKHRVVYSASGGRVAAARVDDPDAIVEHKLYWAPLDSIDEGRYLTAILNSQAMTNAVKPLQSVGDFGVRDIDTLVFVLPFPAYDADNAAHHDLAQLAEHAEHIAAAADLDPAWGFQRARRAVRDALNADGVAAVIDGAVRELIAASAPPPDV